MRTDAGGEERVPVSLFFRDPGQMGAVERRVLEEARGRVLDVGAGTGAISVPLARSGLVVTALEPLAEACAALSEGGVADVRAGGLEALDPGERFDTVVVLMNGLGLPGTLAALDDFLARLAERLDAGGVLLADSTDPTEWADPGDGRGPGEVHMQLEFDGHAGAPFPFLFVAPEALAEACARVGLRCEVLEREDEGRYLARMTRFRA